MIRYSPSIRAELEALGRLRRRHRDELLAQLHQLRSALMNADQLSAGRRVDELIDQVQSRPLSVVASTQRQ